MWGLALAFRRALRERHLLLDLPPGPAAKLSRATGWNGAVQPRGADDFLMAVNEHGLQQGQCLCQRAIACTVDLRTPQRAAGGADATPPQPGRVGGGACTVTTTCEAAPELDAALLLDMRVLVPRGSALATPTPSPSPMPG